MDVAIGQGNMVCNPFVCVYVYVCVCVCVGVCVLVAKDYRHLDVYSGGVSFIYALLRGKGSC